MITNQFITLIMLVTLTIKIENEDVYNEIKEQIALRKEYEGFRLDTRAKVDSSFAINDPTGNLIHYTITYGGKTLYVAHAGPNGANISISGYKLAYSNRANATASGSTYRLSANESAVFVK